MISERQLKRYCSGDVTEIENYENAIADTTRKWVIHHRLELTEDGKFAYSVEELKEKKMYYKRPPSELIFLTKSEHSKLHSKGRSDATIEKIGAATSKREKGKPKKHFDITVSPKDDYNEYMRQYRAKMSALKVN